MGRQLLFTSFKLGHTKDIQCFTILSCMQTGLIGVKPLNVRAFVPSKAFYRGGGGGGCQWTKLCKPAIGSHTTMVLSQGPGRTRPNRRLLSLGRLHGSTAGDAATEQVPGTIKVGGGGGGKMPGTI